jgi:hypothetical protein
LGIHVHFFTKHMLLQFTLLFYTFFSAFLAVLIAWICFATLFEYFKGEYKVTGTFSSPFNAKYFA